MEGLDNETKKYLGIAKKGDVVFLEYDGHLSEDTYERISRFYQKIFEKSGVFCVFLTNGIKLARVEEKTND